MIRALLLASFVLTGCAEVRVYERDGVTYHQNDLSACLPGREGCHDGKKIYYSTRFPQTLVHEEDHVRRGMRHRHWFQHKGEWCTEIADGGETAWKAGDLMCRNAAGDFYKGAKP